MGKTNTDIQSFTEGVKNLLGTLSDACYEAFRGSGDKLLMGAMNALRALECVDLDGCMVNHPLPWRMSEQIKVHGENTDAPILDANGNPLLCRDSGFYPPDIATCKMIVECVNTIWQLQQHKTTHYTNSNTKVKR